MRQILKVKNRLSRTSIQATDSSLKVYNISTDKPLSVGQTIVVVNGVVTATITKVEEEMYEV